MLVESNGDFYDFYWNFEGLTVSLKVVPRVRMEVLVFFFPNSCSVLPELVSSALWIRLPLGFSLNSIGKLSSYLAI